MARLAILGLLSLALLVLKASAQNPGSGIDPTKVDDSDYELDYSGLQPDHIGVWFEPVISPDPRWREDICRRYRNGETLLIIIYVAKTHPYS